MEESPTIVPGKIQHNRLYLIRIYVHSDTHVHAYTHPLSWQMMPRRRADDGIFIITVADPLYCSDNVNIGGCVGSGTCSVSGRRSRILSVVVTIAALVVEALAP